MINNATLKAITKTARLKNSLLVEWFLPLPSSHVLLPQRSGAASIQCSGW